MTITKKPALPVTTTAASMPPTSNNDSVVSTNVTAVQIFPTQRVTIKPIPQSANTVVASFGGPGHHSSKKRKIMDDMGNFRKIDNGRDDRTPSDSKLSKLDAVQPKESQVAGPGISTGLVSSIPKTSRKFKKEVTVQMSQIKFKDIGGMDQTLKQLCELLLHIKHPEVYRHIGLPPPRGFLLHGPPGCGKTLLAQAIAGVSVIFKVYLFIFIISYINYFHYTKIAIGSMLYTSCCN